MSSRSAPAAMGAARREPARQVRVVRRVLAVPREPVRRVRVVRRTPAARLVPVRRSPAAGPARRVPDRDRIRVLRGPAGRRSLAGRRRAAVRRIPAGNCSPARSRTAGPGLSRRAAGPPAAPDVVARPAVPRAPGTDRRAAVYREPAVHREPAMRRGIGCQAGPRTIASQTRVTADPARGAAGRPRVTVARGRLAAPATGGEPRTAAEAAAARAGPGSGRTAVTAARPVTARTARTGRARPVPAGRPRATGRPVTWARRRQRSADRRQSRTALPAARRDHTLGPGIHSNQPQTPSQIPSRLCDTVALANRNAGIRAAPIGRLGGVGSCSWLLMCVVRYYIRSEQHT